MAPEPNSPLAANKEKLWSTMVEALESGRDRMDSFDWLSSDLSDLTKTFEQNWKNIDVHNQSESTRKAMQTLMVEAAEAGRGGFESAEDVPEDIGEFRTKFETIWRNGFGSKT